MYVRCLTACDGVTHVMRAGRVYEVSDMVGRHLVKALLCEEVDSRVFLAQLTGVRAPERRPESRRHVETRG